MISILRDSYYEYTFKGLSSDEKPEEVLVNGEAIPVTNGSVFFEMDTAKLFMYDAENKEWREI